MRDYQIALDGRIYNIPFFKRLDINTNANHVNIFASGPSIADLNIDDSLLRLPSIFVNGSLSLISQHKFTNMAAYVISDERFIKHNAEILEQFYTGQPLFITQPVIDMIAIKLPNLIKQYHEFITLIYAVDRPPSTDTKPNLLKSIPLLNKVVKKKLSLNDFKDNPDFVIDSVNYPQPIGVSLNIENGFIEAGTVAFVAAQLAFSMGASEIHLFGIDLINSSEPRFYESNDDRAPCKLDKAISNRIIPSFNLLSKEYKKREVNVFNHSPVSRLLFDEVEYLPI